MTYVKRLGAVQGIRVWVRAGAALVALVAMFAIVGPRPGSAQSPCADYISGGAGNPASGTLWGSRRVTVTLGVSAVLGGSVSISFFVGRYDMGGGEFREVRCDTYEEWFGF